MGTLQYSTAYYSGTTKVAHSLGGAGQTVSVFTYFIYTVLYVGVGSVILAVVPAVGAYMCAKISPMSALRLQQIWAQVDTMYR